MYMGKRLAFGVVTAALVFTGLYQNCSKVDFNEPILDSKVTTLDRPVDEILKSCADATANGTLVSASQTLDLPDPKVESGRAVVCEWGSNNNLSQAEGTLRSSVAQNCLM